MAASARIQSTFSELVHEIDLSRKSRRSRGGMGSRAPAHSVPSGRRFGPPAGSFRPQVRNTCLERTATGGAWPQHGLDPVVRSAGENGVPLVGVQLHEQPEHGREIRPRVSQSTGQVEYEQPFVGWSVDADEKQSAKVDSAVIRLRPGREAAALVR